MTKSTKMLTQGALFAGLYAVLTVIIAPLSFGAIQCRISDCMALFCYRKKQYVIGYVIGTAIANLFSPLGIIDVFIGALTSFFVGMVMYTVNSKIMAVVVGGIITGVIIGAELFAVYSTPYVETAAYVAVGQAIALTIGAVSYRSIMKITAIKKMME